MTDAGAGLVDLAESIAREAGDLVRQARAGRIDVAATKSSPTDIVTQVDLAAEDLIRRRLRSTRPDDGFVGEESEAVAGTSGVRWIVDPIDGTVNFLYGIPQFAVSIAAEVDGAVVAGVVHNPASGETFVATAGHGATLDGQQISVRRWRDPAEALVGSGYHYRADVRARQAAESGLLVSRFRDVRRLGSAALDLCFVACGRLDAYVERGLRPWDLAAGALIAREAGARVEDLHSAAPSELITVAAPATVFAVFRDELVACGFDDWPLPDWPPARPDPFD
ncbi:MAG: inositol monophosphatase family protein [Nocardioidaceae bacterium]